MLDDDILVSVADGGAILQYIVERTGYAILVEVTEVATRRYAIVE